MPTREQHGAMLAIATPPAGRLRAGPAKRLAMKAADHEEGPKLVRPELLDALPCAHQVLEFLLVTRVVIRLDIDDRTAHAKTGGTRHDDHSSQCRRISATTMVNHNASS